MRVRNSKKIGIRDIFGLVAVEDREMESSDVG